MPKNPKIAGRRGVYPTAVAAAMADAAHARVTLRAESKGDANQVGKAQRRGKGKVWKGMDAHYPQRKVVVFCSRGYSVEKARELSVNECGSPRTPRTDPYGRY